MRAVAIIAAVLCSGCVVTPGNEYADGFYFGLVRLQTTPEQANDTRVVRISTIGGWREPNSTGVGESVGIGWRETQVVAAPQDCRVVVVTDEAPAENDVIQNIISEGGRACMAQRPG